MWEVPMAFGSEMDRPGLSRFRQGLVYPFWHCLEMIPCLCGAIRALSPVSSLPGSRPPSRGRASMRTGGCGHASAIAIAHMRAHRARENSTRLGRVALTGDFAIASGARAGSCRRSVSAYSHHRSASVGSRDSTVLKYVA